MNSSNNNENELFFKSIEYERICSKRENNEEFIKYILEEKNKQNIFQSTSNSIFYFFKEISYWKVFYLVKDLTDFI
jgi:hypothetical protein